MKLRLKELPLPYLRWRLRKTETTFLNILNLTVTILKQMWEVLKRTVVKVWNTFLTAKNCFYIKKKLAIKYKDRLRSHPLRPDLCFMLKGRKIILKLKLAENCRSLDWTMSDLK